MTLYIETARELVLQAGHLVMSFKREALAKDRKEDSSIVTEADLQSDRLLREGLRKAFPDHGILTEEDGVSGNIDSPWTWLIDPLDGTKAYAKGIPGFSVMVGLLKEKEPCLGVVFDPLEDHLYEAVRDHGCFVTHKGRKTRLKVSSREEYARMPVVTSTGFPEDVLKKIVASLHSPLCPPINSVGIKVGLLARQVADIYINHHSVHYWDTCAPQIILQEAGGRMTCLDGSPLKYDLSTGFSHNALTLATNGTRHQDMVDLLKIVFS